MMAVDVGQPHFCLLSVHFLDLLASRLCCPEPSQIFGLLVKC